MKIGRLFNVDIRVHMSLPIWLAVFVGLSLLSGDSLAKALEFPAIMIALLLLVTIHEYAHILTARKFGVDTPYIILSPLGGMAAVEKIPDQPLGELMMSAAGPASNLVMAIPCWLLAQAGVPLADEVLKYNLMIAVFNLIPMFPMDGGRILRSLLDLRMKRTDATWISVRVSHVIAVIMTVVGIFVIHNIMYAVIAGFMALAAYAEAKKCKNVTADDIVRDDPDMTVCPTCGNAVFKDEMGSNGQCRFCSIDQRHPATWSAPYPEMGETAMGYAARTGQLPSQQHDCQIDAITTAHDGVCPCSSYGNPLCPISPNQG
jgi:Zn-dependent protease